MVTQGFDDCTTVYSCFKLLDSFDVMVQRDVIMQDLEHKHGDLVQNFGADLKTVRGQPAGPPARKDDERK